MGHKQVFFCPAETTQAVFTICHNVTCFYSFKSKRKRARESEGERENERKRDSDRVRGIVLK